jgi:hypothetical protein
MAAVPNEVEEGLLLDPSFLLSEPGISWLESNQWILEAVVVPKSFYDMLNESAEVAVPFVPASEVDALETRRDRVLRLIRDDRVEKFGHSDVKLAQRDLEIQQTLALENKDEGLVLADEWTYLRTHSVMFSRSHKPLDAFRRAGVAVLEYGDRFREQLIRAVVTERKWKKGVPVTPEVIAAASAKWVVLGTVGLVVLATVPGAPLVSAALALSFIPGVPAIQAFDPE